jgi:hypothetical protein
MKHILRALLVTSTLCAGISLSAKAPGNELSPEVKHAAMAPERVCFVNTDGKSMLINTLYSDDAKVTQTKCKYTDLSNPTPVRFKIFNADAEIFIDTKYFGAREALLGKGIELGGLAFEKTMQGIINKLEKKNLKKLGGAVKWFEKNFKYLEDFKGTPFVDEYSDAAIMQVKLQSVNELRALLSYLEANLNELPEVKPVLVLSIEKDRTLSTLTEEDVALLESFFEFSSSTDVELRSFLNSSRKAMGKIRRAVKNGKIRVGTSYTQKVFNALESKCDDFEMGRVLPGLICFAAGFWFITNQANIKAWGRELENTKYGKYLFVPRP